MYSKYEKRMKKCGNFQLIHNYLFNTFWQENSVAILKFIFLHFLHKIPPPGCDCLDLHPKGHGNLPRLHEALLGNPHEAVPSHEDQTLLVQVPQMPGHHRDGNEHDGAALQEVQGFGSSQKHLHQSHRVGMQELQGTDAGKARGVGALHPGLLVEAPGFGDG